MKKIIRNISIIVLLSMPCVLVFNEPNPITGEWSYTWNIIGAVYCCWFYHSILKPIKEAIKDIEEENY